MQRGVNKGWFFLIAVLLLVVGVVAYNSSPANPATFGHSVDEIEGLRAALGTAGGGGGFPGLQGCKLCYSCGTGNGGLTAEVCNDINTTTPVACGVEDGSYGRGMALAARLVCPGNIVSGSGAGGGSGAASGGVTEMRAYTVPGTYTWDVPAGVTRVHVRAWGAGGGGGPPSSIYPMHAGGGAYVEDVLSVGGSTLSITVGAGGSPGFAPGGGWGTPGGDTSVGSLIARGGLAGSGGTQASSVGSSNALLIPGEPGTSTGGPGRAAFGGSGGTNLHINGYFPGGGGFGGVNSPNGNGAGGLVVLTYETSGGSARSTIPDYESAWIPLPAGASGTLTHSLNTQDFGRFQAVFRRQGPTAGTYLYAFSEDMIVDSVGFNGGGGSYNYHVNFYSATPTTLAYDVGPHGPLYRAFGQYYNDAGVEVKVRLWRQSSGSGGGSGSSSFLADGKPRAIVCGGEVQYLEVTGASGSRYRALDGSYTIFNADGSFSSNLVGATCPASALSTQTVLQ